MVVAKTEDKLRMKMTNWKPVIELKGLKVNIKKTKVISSQKGRGVVEKSSVYPCRVCGGTVKET